MGVYIFKSRHGPYIKVGHYKGGNAYSRVAHRGFYSCVCPNEIKDRVSLDDLELIAWFPSLTTKEESAIKKRWRISRVGEWYPEELLEPIREFLSMYDRDMSCECDEEKARSTRRRL